VEDDDKKKKISAVVVVVVHHCIVKSFDVVEVKRRRVQKRFSHSSGSRRISVQSRLSSTWQHSERDTKKTHTQKKKNFFGKIGQRKEEDEFFSLKKNPG
jgi:hypothetical protein